MPLLDNKPKATSHSTRRIGLSRQQKPPSLLSKFREQAPGLSRAEKRAESIDDPPLSTEDEDDIDSDDARSLKVPAPLTSPLSRKNEGAHGKVTFRPLDDVESSGDEQAARGDITTTKFTSARKDGNPGRVTRSTRAKSPAAQTARISKRAHTKRHGLRNRSGEEEASPSATPPTSSGEHLRDERGFTKGKKPKVTYRRKGALSQSQSQSPSSTYENGACLSFALLRTACTNDIAGQGGGNSRISRKLLIPDELSSPEKPKREGILQKPAFLSSPSPPPRIAKLKDVFSGIRRGSRLSTDELAEATPNSSRQSSAPVADRKRKREAERNPLTPPPPSRAVFKMPASLSELELQTFSQETIDAPMTDSFLMNSDDATNNSEGTMGDDADMAEEPAALCPWCGEAVDKKLLDDFSKGKRMNVQMQTTFCDKHKKQAGHQEWQQKRYPAIEWDTLKERFNPHHALLLRIINGSDSHFRSIHKQKVERGRARSMKKEGNLTPGYYGPRGFNAMCDYLVGAFGALLKKKAVSDKTIAGRGSAAFIQNVLVAELAVQLIMEDLDLCEDDARITLQESKGLGELLHGDV